MVVIPELYSHIHLFSPLRKKEKLLKYFVLKSYIKWEENKKIDGKKKTRGRDHAILIPVHRYHILAGRKHTVR